MRRSRIAPGARSPPTSSKTAGWSMSAAAPAPARRRATTSTGRRLKAPTTAAGRWRWSPRWSASHDKKNPQSAQRSLRKQYSSRRALRSPRFFRVVSLRDDVVDHGAGDIGQAEVPAAVAIGQLGVIDAEQVQNRRVQVVDVDRLIHRLESEVVGGAVDRPALDP